MNRIIQLMFLALALAMPAAAWGQCASIYQKGETYMKRGRYRDAIKSFKAAMKCDNNLEKACLNKIRECEEKLNPASKPEPPVEVTRFNIDRKELKFGCETRTAENIKVESLPEEWTVTSDAEWCKVTPGDKKLAVSCQTNELTTERKATITLSNGKLQATVSVVQEGQEEFLRITVEELLFSHKGEIKELLIDTNAEWEVADIPEWCEVIAKNSDKLILKVGKSKKPRLGTLIIQSRGGKIASLILMQKRGTLF